MINFLRLYNFFFTHFNPTDPQDMLWHVKQLQQDLPKGKIIVITLIFTAALLTIAAYMIKKIHQEEKKTSPSQISKSQLRKCLIKAGMEGRKNFDQDSVEIIKTILQTYADQRNVALVKQKFPKSNFNFPVEFQIGQDIIKISLFENNNEKSMRIECTCGKNGARVFIGENGLIESVVYTID